MKICNNPKFGKKDAEVVTKEYYIIRDNAIFRDNTIILGIIAISILMSMLTISIPSASASPYDNSSSNTSIDSSVALYLKSSYYASGDVVNISILNMNLLGQGTQLSLDIFLQEDPTYAFKYLGIVEDNVLFVPNKVGNYIIRIYSIYFQLVI